MTYCDILLFFFCMGKFKLDFFGQSSQKTCLFYRNVIHDICHYARWRGMVEWNYA